jgi:hypothetical protein
VVEPTHLGSNLIFVTDVVFMPNYFFSYRQRPIDNKEPVA